MLARRGRSAGSIFTTGPTITMLHSGMGVGQRGEQVEVHPLVDHAVKAEARARSRSLVGRLATSPRAWAKCARSTLDGKGWMLG